MTTCRSILCVTALTASVFAVMVTDGWAQEPEEDRWQGQLELGFNGASGNSSFSVLRTGASFKHLRTDVAEFEWAALLRYGRSDDRTISNDMRTSLKFDWRPQADFSPFVFVLANRDLIRKLDAKVDGGLGAKWTFYRGEQNKMSFSLAGVWNYENFDLAPGSEGPQSKGSLRASARIKYDHTFSSGAKFTHIIFWQPDVSDLGDYDVEMTNSLNTTLLSRLSLGVEHEYLHDAVPQPGVRRSDQRFAVVLRVKM